MLPIAGIGVHVPSERVPDVVQVAVTQKRHVGNPGRVPHIVSVVGGLVNVVVVTPVHAQFAELKQGMLMVVPTRAAQMILATSHQLKIRKPMPQSPVCVPVHLPVTVQPVNAIVPQGCGKQKAPGAGSSLVAGSLFGYEADARTARGSIAGSGQPERHRPVGSTSLMGRDDA